jgi:hypothetical protein
MSNPNITIHDVSTGVETVREMTNEEYAQYEALIADHQPLPSAE